MSDPNNIEGPPPTPEERAAMARELRRVAPTPGDRFRLMFGERPAPRTGEWHGKCHSYHKNSKGRTLMEEAQLIERELAEALDEGEEQARLLGMSGEREAGLLAEVDRLKRWKSEQMAVESSWDPQQVGQALGLPVGSDIRPQILPAIVALKRERNQARGLIKYANKGAERNAEALRISSEKLNEAREQRDRLAEACRWARRELGKHTRPSPIDKALAALEGGTSD